MNVIDTAKADVSEGARRAAVIQVVRTLKAGVATAFAKANKSPGRTVKKQAAMYLAMLDTPMGDALFKLALGSLVPMVPAGALGPLAPVVGYVSRELRVQGAAEVLVQGTDLVLEPMRQGLMGLLEDSKTRQAIQELAAHVDSLPAEQDATQKASV